MIPFVKSFPFSYGTPAALSPLILRIIAENPGPFTFTGTGTYLIGGTEGVAVIDPGPENDVHLNAILESAPGPITHIFTTHTHRDHSALAPALKAKTNAPIYGCAAHPSTPSNAPIALDEGADFDFQPDHELLDGDAVSGSGWTLTAISTPGHAANHLCFHLAEENALFTGDHIMGWSTSVIAPPDGDMADYMASIEKLLARDDDRYYPTHGAPIDKPRPFVEAVKQHRLKRDASILRALTDTPQSIADITMSVYIDIDKKLLPAAALNVMAHLDMHVRTGDVRRDGDAYCKA
ncbi:MAG: MBL fold metallo-hydrolase [Pseudomonadota bacterium]